MTQPGVVQGLGQLLQGHGLGKEVIHPGAQALGPVADKGVPREADDPGTGRVHLSRELGGRGEVPRDDVAAVIAQVLDAPNTIGATFEVFSGDRLVDEAVRSL